MIKIKLNIFQNSDLFFIKFSHKIFLKYTVLNSFFDSEILHKGKILVITITIKVKGHGFKT